jgi:hypothetical protein
MGKFDPTNESWTAEVWQGAEMSEKRSNGE